MKNKDFIIIDVNNTKENAKLIYDKVITLLKNKNISYLTNPIIEDINNIKKENLPLFILTIGGDGTIVRAAKKYKNVPIIGINGGTLGFLAELSKEDFEEKLVKLIDNFTNVNHRKCITLECEILRNNEYIHKDIIVNDVVLSRSNALDMIRFDVYIDKQFIKEYNADGYIIATPLGASAYSLSCNGPLIEPTSKIIELTPIAPHSLINRSIVVDDSKPIYLEIKESRYNNTFSKKPLLSLDGMPPIELEIGDIIKIKKSTNEIDFLCLKENSFVENISKKMYMV